MNTPNIAYIVNVETGEISEIERPADEVAKEIAAAEEELLARSALETAAAAKKAAILDALASATGFTADELRDALNA